jgi:hypothetical protein
MSPLHDLITLKAPNSYNVTLGVRSSTYEFWEFTNIIPQNKYLFNA